MRTPKLLRVLSLGLALLLVSAFAVDSNEVLAQTTYYVDTGGSDANNGLSPVSSGVNGPFRTITRALTAASAGDTISIEGGTYTTIPAAITTNNITFVARPSSSVDEVTLNANIDVNVAAAGGGVSFTGEGDGSFVLAATRTLTLTDGTVTLGANAFELPAAAVINVVEGDIAGSAPVFGTSLDLNYTGANSRTAGLEMPADLGDAGDLTVAFTAADRTLTLTTVAVGATVSVNGNSEIDGTLLVENDVTFTGPGNAGTLDVNSGDVTLASNLAVDDVNIANDSNVDFDIATFVLTVEGSFERLGGTFTYGAGGTLAFVGDGAGATFAPGPNFEVATVTVDKDGQTLTITDDVDLTSAGTAFSVADGSTVSINDEQINIQAAGTVDVDGSLASLTTGGVFFNVAGATITGDGTYSNVTVVTAGGDVLVAGEVDFAGTLALVQGGLDATAGGADISPSGSNADVVVNVDDAGQDVAGSFNGDNVDYDLTYDGTVPSGGLTVGSEFAPNDIRNVVFDITGADATGILTLANLNPGGTDTISGNFTMNAGALVALEAVADDLSIAGTLTIADDADLSGGAAGNTVTLTGDGTSHSIVGKITATTTLMLSAEGIAVTGTTLADGATGADGDEAEVTNLMVANGASATVTNLQVINGNLTVGSGTAADATLVLTMADEQDITGNVTLDGASFTIGSNVDVAGDTDVDSGTFAVGAFIYNSTGTDLAAEPGVTFTRSTGWIRLTTAHTLGSGDATELVTIPGLQTLADITATSDLSFTQLYVDGSGATDDGGFITTDAGEFVRFAGMVNTNGGSLVQGTGSTFFNTTTLTISSEEANPVIGALTTADVVIGTVTEVNDGQTLTIASSDDGGANTARILAIAADFTLDGTLALDDNNVFLAADLINDAGTVTANGGTLWIEGDGNNSFEFTTAGTTLNVPNLRVADAIAVDGAQVLIGQTSNGTLRVTESVIFDTAINENDANDNFAIAAGVDITVNAANPIIDEPTFEGPGDVTYNVAATTGNEIPDDGGVNNLTVQPGGGAAVTIDQDVTVTMTLTLDDSQISRATANDDLTIGEEATLALEGNPANVDITFTPLATNYFLEYGFSDNATIGAFDEFVSGATVLGLTMNLDDAADRLAIAANRSINDLTLQSGIFDLATFDLTVNGDMSILANGDIEGSNDGTLIFEGTEEQTLTLTSNLVIGAADYFDLVFSNTDATVLEGASIALTDDDPMVTFNGVLEIPSDDNFLQLYHIDTGNQGFTLTDGGVFGTVRKEIPGQTTAANRLEFPTADSLGNNRSGAVTFNNPSQISTSARSGIFLGINHKLMSPMGSNNLPLDATNELGETYTIARYPGFYWLFETTSNLSPSVDYDVELEAESYEAFVGENIENLRIIRRQDGAVTNEWIRAANGPVANDNFAISSTHPVGVARSAVGALISTGTRFTFGLESNLPSQEELADDEGDFNDSFGINVGENTVDLAATLGIEGLGTGEFTYELTSGDDAVFTVPSGDVMDPVTITGVAPGTADLTVELTDELNDSRTYTVTVTVNAAFVFGEISDQVAEVGDTLTVDLSALVTGGTAPFTYTTSSADSSVAVATVMSSDLEVAAIAQGVTDITVTAMDATGEEITQMFTVTVALEAADLIDDQEVFVGDTTMVDLTGVFSGTAPFTYTVLSADESVVEVDTSGSMLQIIGVSAFMDGETVGPVEVTVSASDAGGVTTLTTFNVQVLPVYGDAIDDGEDGPTAANASLALRVFLELEDVNAIQEDALDVDDDGMVTPFDASLILQKAVGIIDAFPVEEDDAGKGLTARGTLQWGDVTREGATVTLPLELADARNVMSFALTTSLDREMASLDAIDASLPKGWTLMYNHEEDGTLRIAAFGAEAVDARTVGTLRLTLADANADVALSGEAFVNNLAPQALDAPAITEVPEQFALKGNYPNPFNPSTTIQFDLPQDADVTVQVFDMLGREVMTVASQQVKAGANRALQIDASELASGTYLYRIVARTEVKTLVDTGKMMLIK